MPFFHSTDEDVSSFAHKAVVETGLRYECIKLTKNFDELRKKIQIAEKNKKIVIIIIDAWTLHVDNYNRIMAQFDCIDFYNCEPIVPWNFKDYEINENYERLKNFTKCNFSCKN